MTCIKFQERTCNHNQVSVSKANDQTRSSKIFETSHKDYIEFKHGDGCYSHAGRKGNQQRIILAPSCAEEHTLIHEVRKIPVNRLK